MPKWLRRMLFGITGERLAHAMLVLDEGAVETRRLRTQISRLREEDDPLAALVRNVKSATFHTDGRRPNR